MQWYVSHQSRIKTLFIVFIPLFIAACGGSPQLDTTAIQNEFTANQNPVALLEARNGNVVPSGFGKQIGYNYSDHKYTTVALTQDGYFLTVMDSITKHPKVGGVVDMEDLRVYLKRPDEKDTHEVRIARIKKTFTVGDKAWILLEPNDRFNLLSYFGSLNVSKPSEGTTTQQDLYTQNRTVRVVSIGQPDKYGIAKITASNANLSTEGMITSAIRERARELRRTSPQLTIEEAERLASREINDHPELALAKTSRIGVQVAPRQRLETHGGVVHADQQIIGILPKSEPRSSTPRLESALKAPIVAL